MMGSDYNIAPVSRRGRELPLGPFVHVAGAHKARLNECCWVAVLTGEAREGSLYCRTGVHQRRSAELRNVSKAIGKKPMGDRDADQLLVERVQAGDRQAFGVLVSKYQRRLLRLVSRFVRDPVEAEDVVQESFIKAYRALANFRGESAFYTWLYRIGVNTAKNWLASNGRRLPTSTPVDNEDAEGYSEADLLRDEDTPDRMLQSKQIAETVNAAMEALPEELRVAIALREIDGLSYEEISEAMGCPIGTVRSRIFRAREAIAKELRPLLDHAPDRRW